MIETSSSESAASISTDAVPGTVRVLDRVCERLVAGEDDVVALVVARLALRSASAAARGGASASASGSAGIVSCRRSGRQLDRLERQQRDVVLAAGTERREQAVAELLEVVVPGAHALRQGVARPSSIGRARFSTSPSV